MGPLVALNVDVTRGMFQLLIVCQFSCLFTIDGSLTKRINFSSLFASDVLFGCIFLLYIFVMSSAARCLYYHYSCNMFINRHMLHYVIVFVCFSDIRLFLICLNSTIAGNIMSL